MLNRWVFLEDVAKSLFKHSFLLIGSKCELFVSSSCYVFWFELGQDLFIRWVDCSAIVAMSIVMHTSCISIGWCGWIVHGGVIGRCCWAYVVVQVLQSGKKFLTGFFFMFSSVMVKMLFLTTVIDEGSC